MAKSNWMSRERAAQIEPTSEEPAQQQQGGAPETEKSGGHVMWAGGERITGWGDVSTAGQ
jgi:hypothetical protein